MNKEKETQAFSNGLKQGMIQGINGIISYIKKNGTNNVLSFCEDEIERLKKISAIGLIIFITLISTNIYAKPIPFVKLEAGSSTNVNNVYFVEGIFGIKIKFWEFESKTYGGWLTWFEHRQNMNVPLMNVYNINQKFIYNNIFIRYQHYCAHQSINEVDQYPDQYGNIIYTEAKTSPYWWNGSMKSISIGFEYEFK